MKNLLKLFFLSAACLFPAIHAFSQESALQTRLPISRGSIMPVDEALALNSFIEAPDTIVLLWEIREGYYLYRKSIAVTDADGNPVSIGELPAGTVINDEFFGDVSIYRDRLMQNFPLVAIPEDNHSYRFTVSYQGCAEDRYCYPLQQKQIELTLPDQK